MVRAEVPATDRDAFEIWYETEHLPQALAAFGALAADRGWVTEADLHIARYVFADRATAEKVAQSREIGALIAEFDRIWQGRVTRTREIVEIQQTL